MADYRHSNAYSVRSKHEYRTYRKFVRASYGPAALFVHEMAAGMQAFAGQEGVNHFQKFFERNRMIRQFHYLCSLRFCALRGFSFLPHPRHIPSLVAQEGQ